MASSSKVPSDRGGDGKKGRRNPRLPSAKPAKLDTTWEDQCKLAEVLREMGVTCKACLQGPFKSHDGGPACYKYMVSTGSVTSTRRTCVLRRGGDGAASMTASGRVKEPGVTK